MSFDPSSHLVKLKGNALYLPVTWRLVWLREEYPEAIVETEMVTMDLDRGLYIFRALVRLPNGASATGYGSETEKDFPVAPLEKAETKALGRALAALGLGTQFALEIEEAEGVAAGESRAQPPARSTGPAPKAPAGRSPQATTPARSGGNGAGRPEAQTSPEEEEERRVVRTRLAAAFPSMSVGTWRELTEFAHETYGLAVPTADQERDPAFRLGYLQVFAQHLPTSAEEQAQENALALFRARLAEAESVASVSSIMHEAKAGGTVGPEGLKDLATAASERVSALRSTAV